MSRFVELKRLSRIFSFSDLDSVMSGVSSKAHIYCHPLLYVLYAESPKLANPSTRALLEDSPDSTHKATHSVPKCHERGHMRRDKKGIIESCLLDPAPSVVSFVQASYHLFEKLSRCVIEYTYVWHTLDIQIPHSLTMHFHRPQRRDRTC